MINVEYRWLNSDGVVTARTIKQITVPRIDENVHFKASGREHTGIVKSVSWRVTATTSEARVVLT